MTNLDADPRNADWIKLVGAARAFERWPAARIDAECRPDYRSYLDDVRSRHIAYYASRPDERSATHAFAARTREFAFPPGWPHLASALEDGAWHRHHLSGGSSQVLAIALLSAATAADPSLSWLPAEARIGTIGATRFEVQLSPELLNERPRQTTIDWLVEGSNGVIVSEAKFTEAGFGLCSCKLRAQGACSARVLERPYWSVARTALGLTRDPESPGCALSVAYQPVRNIAAASALADAGTATFLLLFDARNPYFAGAGEWPGWSRTLAGLTAHSPVGFVALSWQDLLARAEVDDQVRAWALAKHGLAR